MELITVGGLQQTKKFLLSHACSRDFGLSVFWLVGILSCRDFVRFGILGCRDFDRVGILGCQDIACRDSGLSGFWQSGLCPDPVLSIIFGKIIFGYVRHVEWLPRSLDLSPLAVFLWVFSEDKLYETESSSQADLLSRYLRSMQICNTDYAA